jgi:hypothetical protein
MIARLASLWQHNRGLLIAFVLALAVTLFFAVRLALFTLYWQDPAHRNEPIAGWMTLGYVAHSWHLKPQEVDAALGLTRDPAQGRISLEKLAQDRGVPVQTLIDKLDALTQSHPPRDE